MRLTGEGIELSLRVLGYQFPEEIDYWDGNWLIIEGSVTHPKGSWRFRDACWTSFELLQLAEWLDAVARGAPDADLGYFTEPCLEFRYASQPEPAIDIILGHECAPPWLSGVERNSGVMLRFLVSANDPTELAVAARQFVETFPVRGAA